MAITKLNTYEVGVNADLSNALNNIDYNRIGIDTTTIKYAAFPASGIFIAKGFLLECGGNLYTSSSDVVISSISQKYIAFDPVSLTFSGETAIGVFDSSKNGYYIGAKRVIRWSKGSSRRTQIYGMDSGIAVDQTGGLIIGTAENGGGEKSVNVGLSNSSSGSESVALGSNVEATASNALAIGAGIGYASADNSISIGGNATAERAIVIGNSLGSGVYSVVIGQLAEASGLNSFAGGKHAKSAGESSVSIGDGSEAAGTGGAAVGKNSKAAGGGLALGNGAFADGEGIAIGKDALAYGGTFVWAGEQFKTSPLVKQSRTLVNGAFTLEAGHYIMCNQTPAADVSIQASFSAGWATIDLMTGTGDATASFFSDGENMRLNNTSGVTATLEYYKW